MSNAFLILGLTPKFDLIEEEIEKKYLDLQMAYHLDQKKGDVVRILEEINHAYCTLKSPLKRAEHLLKIKGIDQCAPDEAILMESMELRSITNNDVIVILKKRVEECLQNVSGAFALARWDQAARHTLRLKYLYKVHDALRKKR